MIKTITMIIGAVALAAIAFFYMGDMEQTLDLATAPPDGEASESESEIDTDRPGWMGKMLPAWYRPEE